MRYLFESRTFLHLTKDEREYYIHDDRRIIEFSYSFVFHFTIFLKDNEIQPAVCPAFGLCPIHKMQDSAQERKADDENESFRQSKQIIVSPQKAQQEEDLQQFEPFRL